MRALIIGKDIAVELDKRGYELVLVSRDIEKLEKVKEILQGKNTEIISLDLSIEDNCKKLYEKVKNIDILVNNAGFGVFGEFLETSLDKEINLINTNIIEKKRSIFVCRHIFNTHIPVLFSHLP